MYLKTDQQVAQIGSVIFRTFNAPNDPQFVMDPAGLNDFWETATTRRDTTPYPNGWGDFQEPARRGSITFSISGTARASTPQELMFLRDQLMSIGNDGTYSYFKVTTSSGIERSRLVSLEGSPRWMQEHDTFASFKISFYSPEPYLYGDRKEIVLGEGLLAGGLDFPIAYPIDYGSPIRPEVVTVENIGNTPAWPVFEITGEFASGFTISNNLGSQVVYNGMVSSSAPVTIDMRKGAALQNGLDRSTLLGFRQWFSIPAYGSLRPTFRPIQAGSGWCTVIFRDTWT